MNLPGSYKTAGVRLEQAGPLVNYPSNCQSARIADRAI